MAFSGLADAGQAGIAPVEEAKGFGNARLVTAIIALPHVDVVSVDGHGVGPGDRRKRSAWIAGVCVAAGGLVHKPRTKLVGSHVGLASLNAGNAVQVGGDLADEGGKASINARGSALKVVVTGPGADEQWVGIEVADSGVATQHVRAKHGCGP